MKKLYPLLFIFSSLFIFAQETPVKIDSIYSMVKEPAEFPGGVDEFRKAVMKNFKNPSIKRKGRYSCEASFVIDREGNVTEIQFTGDALLGKAMVRAISNIKTRWIPAKINGEPVGYNFRFPMTMNYD